MTCVVAGCSNKREKGKFFGNMCVPCHNYASREFARMEADPNSSNLYRTKRNELIVLLREAEIVEIRIRYDALMVAIA